MCSSPWLIAAYRGLHRLCVPRHPPYAFFRLTPLDVKQKTSETGPGACLNTRDLTSDTDRMNPVLIFCRNGGINPAVTDEIESQCRFVIPQSLLISVVKKRAPG